MPTVLDILATLRDIPETARDTLAAALTAGTGVTITVNDGANTITITAVPAAGSIALSNMASLAANSVIGNNTGSAATPIALTQAQATALLNAFTGDSGSGGVKGLVPAPAAGDNAAGKFLKAGGTWAIPSSTSSYGLHVRDVQSSGTDGPSLTAAAWNARVLNTSVLNTISGASLGSNRVTLPAGTFDIHVRAPSYSATNSFAQRLKLVNTSGPADLVQGMNTHASLGGIAVLDCRLTLASPTTIEVQHYISGGVTVNGGRALSSGSEIYTEFFARTVQ